MRDALLTKLENEQLKTDLPDFRVGDKLRIHTKIIEGNKERIQVFEGTCIARKGKGLSETISLHRVAYGTGMERVFLIHSPRVVNIEILKEGDVRRAKLYYLRGKQGKAARVKGRVVARKKLAPKATVVEAATEAPAPKTEAKDETASANDNANDNAKTEEKPSEGESKE